MNRYAPPAVLALVFFLSLRSVVVAAQEGDGPQETSEAGSSQEAGEGPAAGEPPEPDPEVLELWRQHLRASFDDIHDVSMRFHLEDPSLGGLIGLRMTWQEGRLVAGEVVVNETGNDAEAEALLEAVRGWTIEGLEGPVTFNAAFRIRLVGSDHPEFANRAIVTGTVQDPDGAPISGATVAFTPLDDLDEDVPDARSNREGVFVRTLIPPGSWELACSAAGFASRRVVGLSLAAGSHHIARLTLEPEPDND